jgi:hypothetical protein
MDGNSFDDWTRRLAAGRSRRSVLRGMVAGSAAVVAARAGSSLAAPGGKVSLCHLTGNGSYQSISVSQNAVGAHLAHGDAVCTESEYCGEYGCCANVRLEAAGCFWMENTSGRFCWEPRVHTFEDCQALDACGEGGGGESVTGCYKWATSSDTAIAPPW